MNLNRRVRKASLQEEASAKSAQGRCVGMPTAVYTIYRVAYDYAHACILHAHTSIVVTGAY